MDTALRSQFVTPSKSVIEPSLLRNSDVPLSFIRTKSGRSAALFPVFDDLGGASKVLTISLR